MLWTISLVLTIPWLLGLVRSRTMERPSASCRCRPGFLRDDDWCKKVLVCRIDERDYKGDRPMTWH
jgi:hypothetical protein